MGTLHPQTRGGGVHWLRERSIETYSIPQGTEPSVSTRVKMAQTSNVYALVKADGRYHVTSKEIKVTLGGCGG